MDLGAVTAAAATLWHAQRREIVARFGGTSMMPSVAPGEEVRILCGAAPKMGNVVFFLRANRPIVHRVVAITPRGLWTRGDANLLPDGAISEQEVVGVVASVSRSGQWVDIRWPRPSVTAAVFLVVCRLGGEVVTSALWRARSLAARTALRALRVLHGDAPNA